MGSFNATCIVSGLAIEDGDPVRFLTLTGETKNLASCIHGVAGRWQIRTPPLRAKYNSYGSVDNIEAGLVERVFFKSLDADALETGVGDNQAHDVAVRKGMSQGKWLRALWEGRVYTRDVRESLMPGSEGFSTLKRVEGAIKKAGLLLAEQYGSEGSLVDELRPGFFRVRNRNAAELEVALLAIRTEGFAAMAIAGTGPYADKVEILVGPKPGGQVGHFSFSEEGPQVLPISAAMIREDVWQILLGMKLRAHSRKLTIQKLKEYARTAIEALGPHPQWLGMSLSTNYFLQRLGGIALIPGFTLQRSLLSGIELAESKEELECFVDELAEVCFAEIIYGSLHGQWHLSTNSSQDGNWKMHRGFLRALSKLKGDEG